MGEFKYSTTIFNVTSWQIELTFLWFVPCRITLETSSNCSIVFKRFKTICRTNLMVFLSLYFRCNVVIEASVARHSTNYSADCSSCPGQTSQLQWWFSRSCCESRYSASACLFSCWTKCKFLNQHCTHTGVVVCLKSEAYHSAKYMLRM